MKSWLTLIGALLALAIAAGAWFAWLNPIPVTPSVIAGVDLHAHAAGIGAGGSGAFVSPALENSYKFPIYLKAFDVTREALETHGDGLVIRRIAEHVANSTRISHAVVLALDGVVDAKGQLDVARTQVYMPNAFVAAETARFDQLLFGASINPYRHDALARLEQVNAAGAVLVKWIPGIMGIDPADERIKPFYRRLQALELPLLTHAGDEHSFGVSDDRLGDPLRLRLALENGVTVIVAHVASAGKNHGQSNYQRLLPLFEQYPNLYADISALTQFNRLGKLRPTLADDRLKGRLVYGSDWPLQFFPLVSPWYQWPQIDAGQLKAIAQISNPWDRDVALKQAMGMGDEVLRLSQRLMGLLDSE